MEEKQIIQLQEVLNNYLAARKLRQSEERSAILNCICNFQGHFDINSLHDRLEEINFHVSKATLYNNMDLFISAGLIVRHQLTQQVVQYELRILAETHVHLICTHCGAIREMEGVKLNNDFSNQKIRKFTPAYQMVYVYGLCSKCKFRLQQQRMK